MRLLSCSIEHRPYTYVVYKNETFFKLIPIFAQLSIVYTYIKIHTVYTIYNTYIYSTRKANIPVLHAARTGTLGDNITPTHENVYLVFFFILRFFSFSFGWRQLYAAHCA